MAFKVIEGGGQGPPDYEASAAVEAFKMMVIELLRALVRGDDIEARIARNLDKFLGHLGETDQHPQLLVGEAIKSLHACLDKGPETELWSDLERVVLASLLVAAETCCADDAAQGRTSQRRSALQARIEAVVRNRNRRK